MVVERSRDWLNQAYRDIRQTEVSLKDGLYEWSCFAAQHAAEKAVKALIQRLGGDIEKVRCLTVSNAEKLESSMPNWKKISLSLFSYGIHCVEVHRDLGQEHIQICLSVRYL